MKRLAFAVWLFPGILVLLAGCVQQTKAAPAAVPVTQPALSPEVVAHNAQVIAMLTDPCAGQLDEIGGALVKYFRDRHAMPATLEALVPYARKFGWNLGLTCPVSKEPYVYVPQGLGASNQARRLMVYDSQPVHDGWRWGLVMAPPMPGMADPHPEVIRLSEEVLKVYLASGPK